MKRTFLAAAFIALLGSAGVVALVMAMHPTWTPEKIRRQIRSNARDLGQPIHDPEYGDGLVDAFKSLYPGGIPSV
jgi:serine protease